jgi:hypothetical protein
MISKKSGWNPAIAKAVRKQSIFVRSKPAHHIQNNLYTALSALKKMFTHLILSLTTNL